MHDQEITADTDDKRSALWIVFWLNVSIAVGFFITGYLANSSALFANGLDNSSDAAVYGLSLFALLRSRKWKRGAARLSGILLLVFAVGIVADAVRRYLQGSEPVGAIMMGMAVVAAIVNLISLRLLRSLENQDVNLRAATTFSLNDFVSNGGIVLAGIGVMVLKQNWPDLIVGLAVGAIAVYGGITILREAHSDAHEEEWASR